ncbi:hypothetical protein QUF58_13090 [Anaerolineales bacterium HSG24]|nr:hypothetical protein [Anaerolineales bacterium HSG24]
MTTAIMSQTITPEKLLTLAEQLTLADQQWLLEQLDRLVHQNGDEQETLADEQPVLSAAEAEERFLAEVAAFERMKPELLKTHYGQVVGIYQEQVAVVGETREAVLREMGERFGNVPCYIEWVDENVPRQVRITSAWKVRP